MRWTIGLTTALTIALLIATPTQAFEETTLIDPVDCMNIDNEGMDTLYSTMHEVLLSIQVCTEEKNYTNAAELYFITWPFLIFNNEVTKDDHESNAYVNALDATMQHYFDNMDTAEQDVLFDHLDKIVQTPEYRARMCYLLTSSKPPLVDIKQDEQAVELPDNAVGMWANTVREYGCE